MKRAIDLRPRCRKGHAMEQADCSCSACPNTTWDCPSKDCPNLERRDGALYVAPVRCMDCRNAGCLTNLPRCQACAGSSPTNGRTA